MNKRRRRKAKHARRARKFAPYRAEITQFYVQMLGVMQLGVEVIQKFEEYQSKYGNPQVEGQL